MKANNKNICDYAKVATPILGYYSGKKEGFNNGFESASNIYARKVKELNDCNNQLKRDLLLDYNAFISPNGWDAEYWQKLMNDFIAQNPAAGQSAKDILVRFIEYMLEKVPSSSHSGATLLQLKTVLEILRANPRERVKFSNEQKDDIETAIDFLDMFSSYSNEDERDYVKELLHIRYELNAALDKSEGCNFLILGKTGTGKSALLNYVLGSNEAVSGVGRPVTERGLHKKDGVIRHGDSSVIVHVYDSWGLEAGHYNEWLEMMDGEKQRHDFHHKITDWFHVVVYCVQASGARVEPVDTEAINYFLKNGFKVIVALTKVDNCSEEDEQTLHRVILEDCPKMTPDKVISVCAVEKEIRGVLHKAFGGEEIKRAITDSYIGTIVNQLPLRCQYLANIKVDEFAEDVRRWISTRGMWDSDNLATLKNRCDQYMATFNANVFPHIIGSEIQSCAKVSESLSVAINVDDNYFKRHSTDFYEEDESWFERVGKTVAAVVMAPVAALYVLFGGGSKMERDELNGRLNRFVEELRAQISKSESSIREKICQALHYNK